MSAAAATRRDWVPNDVLRERFNLLAERDGLTLGMVAKEIGWLRRPDASPDQRRVGRALGLREDHGRTRQHVAYHNAVQLARALDLDPFEAGV